MSEEKKEEKKDDKKKKSPIAAMLGFTGLVIAALVFFYVNGATIPMTISAAGNLITESGNALKTIGTGGYSIADGIHATRLGWSKVFIEILIIIAIFSVVSFVGAKMVSKLIESLKKMFSGGDGHH